MLPQQEHLTSTNCCRSVSTAGPPSLRRRDIVSGGLSLGVWIFLPKCPACFGAHLALWTGLGLTFTQAAYARWLLMCLCAASLCYLAGRRVISRT